MAHTLEGLPSSGSDFWGWDHLPAPDKHCQNSSTQLGLMWEFEVLSQRPAGGCPLGSSAPGLQPRGDLVPWECPESVHTLDGAGKLSWPCL